MHNSQDFLFSVVLINTKTITCYFYKQYTNISIIYYSNYFDNLILFTALNNLIRKLDLRIKRKSKPNHLQRYKKVVSSPSLCPRLAIRSDVSSSKQATQKVRVKIIYGNLITAVPIIILHQVSQTAQTASSSSVSNTPSAVSHLIALSNLRACSPNPYKTESESGSDLDSDY